MGVMKEVGLAVREGQSFEWYKDRFAHVLRCIGIAPWGYVKNRHVLTDNSPTCRVNNKYITLLLRQAFTFPSTNS